MSTVTPALSLWGRPAWDTDRWVRDFFGPVTAKEWATDTKAGINPAVEVAKDGDDAV
ncbi:MAG: Hsp20/alpha crystallin family protein, partial [Mycobacterium sp.]|nr:Hsp20/alpha crystallin family protein [Mycobacterium sp.]